MKQVYKLLQRNERKISPKMGRMVRVKYLQYVKILTGVK